MKQVGKVKFTMNYQVIRTQRRTISLEITRDLRIVVRAPLHVSDSEIRRFVDEHQDWISVHLDKQKIRLENKIRLTEEQRYLLRVLAEDELPKKVRHFGGLMNLLPDRVGITEREQDWEAAVQPAYQFFYVFDALSGTAD